MAKSAKIAGLIAAVILPCLSHPAYACISLGDPFYNSMTVYAVLAFWLSTLALIICGAYLGVGYLRHKKVMGSKLRLLLIPLVTMLLALSLMKFAEYRTMHLYQETRKSENDSSMRTQTFKRAG